MVKENLLAPYRSEIATGKLVSRDTAKNALGQNVDGYVIPMFHSQIAFAYNPAVVKAPPKSYAELAEWVKKNPKQFGYNGVKGGMSGVGFVMGWVSANSGHGRPAREGSVRPGEEGGDRQVAREPQGVQPERRADAGQRRHARHAESRRDLDGPGVGRHVLHLGRRRQAAARAIKLSLPQPGLPGQPMYYVVPAKAANAALAKKFIDFAASPEIQAEGIVKQFNWYPGIDAQYVKAKLDEKSWNKLFTDITPEALASYGRPFPLSEYFTDILEGYERVVLK